MNRSKKYISVLNEIDIITTVYYRTKCSIDYDVFSVFYELQHYKKYESISKLCDEFSIAKVFNLIIYNNGTVSF